jgi:hypothetical protein
MTLILDPRLRGDDKLLKIVYRKVAYPNIIIVLWK